MDVQEAKILLAKVLPLDGSYYVLQFRKQGQRAILGAAKKSIDELMSFASYIDDADKADWWFCTSTTHDVQSYIKEGKEKVRPIRRTENAVSQKAIFADIDVKPSAYKDTREAMKAVLLFCEAANFPTPTAWVLSGSGGLHVYWTLIEHIPIARWAPLAHALAEALRRHGVKFDAGCTTDAVRILRLPGTINQKPTGGPVRILKLEDYDYSLERIERALEPYKIALPSRRDDSNAMVEALVGQHPPAILTTCQNDDLGAGIDTALLREDIRACLDAIPNDRVSWEFWNTVGMRVYAATEGQDYGLEEWQRWSNTNTDAAAAGADSCEDRWEAYHGTPPTRTGAGALINQAREALNDPKWLPYKVSEQTTQHINGAKVALFNPFNYLPGEYFVHNGIVMRNRTDKEGNPIEPVPVFPYEIRSPYIEDTRGQPKFIFDTTTGIGITKHIEIPLHELSDKYTLAKSMLRYTAFMTVREAEQFGDFIVSWARELQKQCEEATVEATSFGWHVPETSTRLPNAWTWGGKTYFENGDTTPSASIDADMREKYSARGSIEPWLAAAEMITDQKRPALDIILASAFAGPLVHFTAFTGLVVSGWSSGSGKGKSTAVLTAQAVWAAPRKARMILSDTGNWSNNVFGILRNIPVYWDELKSDDDIKQMLRLIFQLTQGREKGRMNRGLGHARIGDWRTFLVICSNDMLLDHMAQMYRNTPAGMYRLTEFRVGDIPPEAPKLYYSDVERMIGDLDYNYGWAGQRYSEFLCTNIQRIDKDVEEESRRLADVARANQEERYWTSSIACLLLGARYANELGLTKLDIGAMESFLLDNFQELRKFRDTQPLDMSTPTNMAGVLSQFLADMTPRHVLVTDEHVKSVGRPSKTALRVLCDGSRIDGLYVHIADMDNTLFIQRAKFAEWLRARGWSSKVVIDSICRGLGGEEHRGTLGAGTPYAWRAPDNLIKLSLAHPELTTLTIKANPGGQQP